MRKKETIILLDKKQSYKVLVHGGNRIGIRLIRDKEKIGSIGILDPRKKLVIKGW